MLAPLRRGAVRVVDVIDPLPALRRLPLHTPPTSLISVYRRRNAAHVLGLMHEMPERNVYLWALDEFAPELKRHTIGSGPGGRFELLNRLAEATPPDDWLIVADDDVAFRPGGVLAFVALACRLELSLAQPAHARRGSHYYHPITGRRPLRLGRETTFVEVGPVLAISPAIRQHVVPFPEEGMGWGTELLWYDLQQRGWRLGIIDATPMRHLSPIANNYDVVTETERQQRLFSSRGLRDWPDIQRTLRSRLF